MTWVNSLGVLRAGIGCVKAVNGLEGCVVALLPQHPGEYFARANLNSAKARPDNADLDNDDLETPELSRC